MIAFQPYNDVFHQLSNTAGQHDRKKQKDYGSHEKLGFCTDSSLYTEKIIHSTYFNIPTSFPLQFFVGTFGSSTAPWSSVREFIFRKTQRASSQEVSGRRSFASGQCHCKLQGTKRNPIETPKSPALITLRSGSTNILIRASAIFIASIRTCLGYKVCEVIFIPSYFDKTNPWPAKFYSAKTKR